MCQERSRPDIEAVGWTAHKEYCCSKEVATMCVREHARKQLLMCEAGQLKTLCLD